MTLFRKIPPAVGVWATGILLASQSVAAESLIVSLRDGTSASFELDQRPNLFFEASRLIVRTGNMETTYDADAVSKFTFGNPSGVLNPVLNQGETRLVFMDRDYASVSGLEEGTVVSVYTIGGRLAATERACETGVVAFDLSAYASGVYIISISNGQTYKIVK